MNQTPRIVPLVDCRERAAESPDTFDVPSAAEIGGIHPGLHVKLFFEGSEFVERMWVIVKDVKPDGTFTGTIDNDPLQPDWAHNDLVAFSPEHIADIHDFREAA